MRSEIHTIDSNAHLVLPKSFANATVIVEQWSDSEIRIHRSTPSLDATFAEETTKSLSDIDRDRFLELLANPPEPNSALQNAATRHKTRHG